MKKFLSVVLTLMMVFSVFTTVSAADPSLGDLITNYFGPKDPSKPFLTYELPVTIKASKDASAPADIQPFNLDLSTGGKVNFATTLDMDKLRKLLAGTDFIDTLNATAKDKFENGEVSTTIVVDIEYPGVTVEGNIENIGEVGVLANNGNGIFRETLRTLETRTPQEGNKLTITFKDDKKEQQDPTKKLIVKDLIANRGEYLKDIEFRLYDVAKYTTEGEYDLKVTMNGTTTVIFDNSLSLTVKYTGYDDFRVSASRPGSPGGGTTKYALTYETDGGSAIDKETYTRNSTVKLTKVPKKEGYIFEGWYLDKELTQRVTEVKMTKNTTVYAGWVEDNGIAGGGYDTPEKLNGDDHFAYIVGYPEGDVRPGNNITRAEVTTIFFRLLKENERNMNLAYENSFSDVEILDWYNTAVSTMAKLGIVNGRNAESFDPNAFITRAEFAAICARFADTAVEAENKFTDVAGHWAEKEIYEAAEYGWIRGYEDNTFRPDRFITRAEAMTMINRVLNRIPETANDLLDTMKKWSDNSDEAAWYYIPVQEATNSHDYDKKNHIYEKWTSLNENFDWTKYEQ